MVLFRESCYPSGAGFYDSRLVLVAPGGYFLYLKCECSVLSVNSERSLADNIHPDDDVGKVAFPFINVNQICGEFQSAGKRQDGFIVKHVLGLS